MATEQLTPATRRPPRASVVTGHRRPPRRPDRRPTVGSILEELVGPDLPIRVEAYDGSAVGPPDAAATVAVRSPDALRRIVTAPGELGLARAYVTGDLEVDGDLAAVLGLREVAARLRFDARTVRAGARLLRAIGPAALRPLPPPPEEAHPHGRRHTRRRDAAAIAHHYDVGNDFYEILLGPSMTYSCAVWDDASVGAADGLERAQAAKYELICRKLGLRPGQRLLDVGCGWGGMVRHAATHHGVHAVGITVSREQAAWARRRVAADGLTDRVEIRLQDYRDIDDGPYDAISSIGMFEHVGRARLGEYFRHLHELVGPGGRLLNHAISRPPDQRAAIDPGSFMARYVFPDGELIEVGAVVTAMQTAGFEARHLEDLREHYALTLRAWLANLERNWDAAVAAVGAARARVWRLYIAGSALAFDDGGIRVNQVLGVRLAAGDARMPLRPDWC